MKKVLAILALCLSTSALATQGGESNNTGCNGVGNANSPCAGSATATGGNATIGNVTNTAINTNTNTNANTIINGNANTNKNTNSNVNTQGQAQGQAQKQKQSQGQGQSQSTATTTSTATETSTSTNQSQSADNKGNAQNVTINEAKQTPAAPGMAAYPTAPCRVGVGVGVGVVGFSGGVSGSVLDEGCDAREDARFIREVLGDTRAAYRRACQKPEIAAALGKVCQDVSFKKADAPAAAPVQYSVTQPSYSGF